MRRSKYKKYRKLKNAKISYIFDKTLVFLIISDKCGSKDEEVFKKRDNWDIKIFGSIKHVEECQVNL